MVTGDCRMFTRMEYREVLLEDARARFRTSKSLDLLQPEILQMIFVET